MSSHCPHRVRAVVCIAICMALTLSLAATPVAAQGGSGFPFGGGFGNGGLGTRAVPPPTYFGYFNYLYDGEFDDAVKGYRMEGRGAIKNINAYWIDSICFHTMMGECYFQMGTFGEALSHYNQAVDLYLANPDWMIRVQFPPVLQQSQTARSVPWGQSARTAILARIPDTMPIAQGRIDNSQQLQNGGVVTAPVLFPVNVQEIVRCTALAIRRRAELLGPLTETDDRTNNLIAALGRRPGINGHWSSAWIDAQLGMAYVAANRLPQARAALERAVLAGGQFDHGLTGMALLEMGRMAMNASDFNSAEKLFLEASYSAYHYGDAMLIEEALRYGALNHLAAGRPGLYPPLAQASAWANKERFQFVQASLLTIAAENAAALRDTKSALGFASSAASAIGRRMMGRGRLGARLNFALAQAKFQTNDTGGGDAALNASMAFATQGSLWSFQVGLIDAGYVSGQVTARAAMEMYTSVLREPTSSDWKLNTWESLASLMVPRHASMENWFAVAVERREHERALEIADAARRHRFYSTLDYGGRLMALRWLLEADDIQLNQQAVLDRQQLLTAFPGYAPLSRDAAAVRKELHRIPLVSPDEAMTKQRGKLIARLSELSTSQERILREMIVSRVGSTFVFPAHQSTKDLQAALGPRQGLLAFFSTSRSLYVFLMSNDKYGYWQVPSPVGVQRKAVALLRELGNYEGNHQVTLDVLESESWKQAGADLFKMLMTDGNVSLPEMFDELVIVPDGLLWYVPFEALPIPTADGNSGPMITHLRVRYSPFVSTAVGDKLPRRKVVNTAVALGKLYLSDNESVSRENYADLAAALPGTVALTAPSPIPSPQLISAVDRLIVYADIASSSSPYGWSPTQLEIGRGGQLNDWFALPWGGPEQVLLPGFHTAAENSLKSQPLATAGADVFLALAGLYANGARTVLLSRWRPAGQTTYDLMREFALELPYSTAAEAWQRSVFVVSEFSLNPELEPRVAKRVANNPPTAKHPFFWAAYLLADTGAMPESAIPEPEDDNPGADVIQGLPPAVVPAAPPAVPDPAPAVEARLDAGN